jgi:hypothetical protein
MLLATEPARCLAALYELGFVSPGDLPGALSHDPKKAVMLGPKRKEKGVFSEARRIFVCGSAAAGKVSLLNYQCV